jgi:uncharacterized SAM-binding protein YcdF (DUF218 family)
LRRVGLALAIALVLLLPTAWAGGALVVEVPLSDPDAILSLASHEWERLPRTAALAASFPRARVILTDPSLMTEANCHDCANRGRRLVRLGVDASRIVHLPVLAAGTHGEALAALGYTRANEIKRLVIVTSPYHTRRSLATFRAVFDGSGVVLGIQPASVTPAIRPAFWWLQGYDRAYVPYEWAAVLYYRWQYGIPVSASGMP